MQMKTQKSEIKRDIKSLLQTRISCLVSRISYLASHVSHLVSRTSKLANFPLYSR